MVPGETDRDPQENTCSGPAGSVPAGRENIDYVNHIADARRGY